MDCPPERPNRSDLHLSKEEESKIEEETRQHFDELAPKRHSKPQRSDYSEAYVDANNNNNTNKNSIPEYLEFQKLEHDQEKLGGYNNNGSQMSEEFVETEYYKDLNCVDKQHHTTGTGFINMENNDEGNNNNNTTAAFNTSMDPHHESCQSNPATNDWIPTAAADQDDAFVSGKPKRSDN